MAAIVGMKAIVTAYEGEDFQSNWNSSSKDNTAVLVTCISRIREFIVNSAGGPFRNDEKPVC
ncbi:MAG: hypothetical protein DMG20_04660 [Acidobacteria bacterium]|nr:MAG: hypothetical protein DMG20_04660 [Acidobacteriota bacterium]